MLNLSKWSPFKFARSTPPSPAAPEQRPASPPPTEQTPPPESAPTDRALGGLFRDPFASLLGGPWFGDFTEATFQPRIDVVDEQTHLTVSAELPGMDGEHVKIHAHDGMLTIQGVKTQESTLKEEGCYRVERYFGAFRRTIPLPLDVDTTRARARFDKGVLTVRLPKKGAA